MVNFLLNLSTIEIGTFRAHWRNPSKNMSKCGWVIVTFPSNSSVHYICQLFLLFLWLLFCWSWRWFPFIFVAENRFEHGNYLSSNNQFLDSSDDAAFIFVSSELKVIKFEITSNGCEFISSPDLQLKTIKKQSRQFSDEKQSADTCLVCKCCSWLADRNSVTVKKNKSFF